MSGPELSEPELKRAQEVADAFDNDALAHAAGAYSNAQRAQKHCRNDDKSHGVGDTVHGYTNGKGGHFDPDGSGYG